MDGAYYLIRGPADLNALGPGEQVVVDGQPDPQHDLGRWSGSIGMAVLRGVEVRKV